VKKGSTMSGSGTGTGSDGRTLPSWKYRWMLDDLINFYFIFSYYFKI
jgi:hypothetical protein